MNSTRGIYSKQFWFFIIHKQLRWTSFILMPTKAATLVVLVVGIGAWEPIKITSGVGISINFDCQP